MPIRSWKYRLYPSREQQKALESYLHKCRRLWNSLLRYVKAHYDKTGKFPSRNQLYLQTKGTPLFSQVSQNVADRLVKAMHCMISKKKAGMNAGFPRFKSAERMKSFTYPQFGFKISERLQLSGIGSIAIRKHREMRGKAKTLTIKKSASGKWFAVFTTALDEKPPLKKHGPKAGIDIGLEHFAYLSDGSVIQNPRHLKEAEEGLKTAQKRLSMKKKGSKNRRTARLRVAVAYQKLTNRRRDFLHKASRQLVDRYSLIAMENLNVAGLARSFLAKGVLDCSWAEFASMLAYKAEEAGCEVMLVGPAHTTQRCSRCGLVRKKSLAERWHSCICGASMHRDLNAAINILDRAASRTTFRSRSIVNDASFTATAGTAGSNACVEERSSSAAGESDSPDGEETSAYHNDFGQVSSMKQEAHAFSRG